METNVLMLSSQPQNCGVIITKLLGSEHPEYCTFAFQNVMFLIHRNPGNAPDNAAYDSRLGEGEDKATSRDG
jgi:hypothetical protein